MATLEYVKCTNPPQFISTGNEDFPDGLYTLEGKFPLDWNDLYDVSDKFHKLNGKRVTLIGFTTTCDVGNYSCSITVEPVSLKILEEIDLNNITIDLS